jgi:hypothetical protein
VRAPNGTLHLVDVSGAGTGPFQGTEPFNINAAGDITGPYVDRSGVNHGFLRIKRPCAQNCSPFAPPAPNRKLGAIITFDVSGAGTGSGQGTIPIFNSPANAITGYYIDASGVNHGFLRTAVEEEGEEE